MPRTEPVNRPEPDHVDARDLLEEYGAVLAHELATPLAIINGAADLALCHGPDTPAGEHLEVLEMIRRNSELAELVLSRLGLARDVESGTVQLARSRVDLALLVEQSVNDLRQVMLGAHPVTVTVSERTAIFADPTATREIVFNLLTNAAKYSESDAAIEVRVSVDREDAEVVVRDHGEGVTSGDAERIFERFHQGKTSSPGTGLGLFISRGLARAHGGDVSVRSAERVGSEFRLTLPIEERLHDAPVRCEDRGAKTEPVDGHRG